jgi:hypothetical protein
MRQKTGLIMSIADEALLPFPLEPKASYTDNSRRSEAMQANKGPSWSSRTLDLSDGSRLRTICFQVTGFTDPQYPRSLRFKSNATIVVEAALATVRLFVHG